MMFLVVEETVSSFTQAPHQGFLPDEQRCLQPPQSVPGTLLAAALSDY